MPAELDDHAAPRPGRSSSCASTRGCTGRASAASRTPSSTWTSRRASTRPTSPGDDEELRTIYVDNDKLDLSAWARDAIALELPDKILCRPDCAGLCPVCGKNLNDEPHDHGEPEPDSRWAALAELKEQALVVAAVAAAAWPLLP